MSTVQRITSRYIIDYEDTKIDLPRENESFLEIYRCDKFGLLQSVAIEFNSDRILIEMYIDDVLFLSVKCDDISINGNKGGVGFSEVLSFDGNKDILKFKPRFPVMFRDNFYIKAKADSNSSSRDFERIIVERTEE